MKSWKVLHGGSLIIMGTILASILTGRDMFKTPLEYYTALLLFGFSMVSLLISTLLKNERYSFGFAYSSVSLMLTAAFAYAIISKEFNYASILLYTISLLVTFGSYIRFGELRYLEDFWIILLSATGFWIILIKFSNLGTIALLLAINTSLLITFLSYALLEEELEETSETAIEGDNEVVFIGEIQKSIAEKLEDLTDILLRTFFMLLGVFLLVLFSRKFYPDLVFSRADIKSFLITLAIIATLILYGKIFSKSKSEQA